MKNIVIITNSNKDVGFSVTKSLAEKLSSCGANVYAEEKHAASIPSVIAYSAFPKDAELIVVVGGDGSMLDASVIALENDIPMLGVNLGKVGYLTEIEPDRLDILDMLFTGKYRTEEKMLLTVSHIFGKNKVKSERLAVNDVIISHDTFLGIADFVLRNREGECVKYRADGMIFSTPAGSTAYSLSAGGPVIAHDIDSILATPICPHSFFNRSIIFNANECLTVKNSGETPLNISVDGRCFAKMESGDECIVETSGKRLKTITFSENNMFSTLFKKMRILEDVK